MNISDLIPANVKAFVNKVLDASEALLQGETARAIGYGGGLVLFLVAKFSGTIPDMTFGVCVAQAVAAEALLALLIEPIRHYVSSPATVAVLESHIAADHVALGL